MTQKKLFTDSNTERPKESIKTSNRQANAIAVMVKMERVSSSAKLLATIRLVAEAAG